MIHPKSTPIESFEPGLTKVAPELVEQINQKGGPADEAEGLRMVVDTLLKTIGALHSINRYGIKDSRSLRVFYI